MQHNTNRRVEEAIDVCFKAEDSFVSVLKELYPVGSHQTVVLGGHELEIEIEGHCTWGSAIGYLYGLNVNTMKKRRFYVGDIVD